MLMASTVLAQRDKVITAFRLTEEPPRIDGVLDDAAWQKAVPSNSFFPFEPGNIGTVPESLQTEVWMAYDNDAIYVAAFMHYPHPDSIAGQYSQRDDINTQADHFAIALNTYDDGINETRFYITSAGTIGDSKVNESGEDFSYNVVFVANISRDEKGWYAEFEIPYNALRFPEKQVQDWSVNFYRKLIKENETHSWNFIDKEKGRQTQYNGSVIGLKNIKPPVRLNLFPYVQGVVQREDGTSSTSVSAGMDIKYGLSNSFTLDATLIPDFGQVGYDNVQLNLGPFEQTFSEKRQFFIEGIELFDKGGTFFSRRIGSAPTRPVQTDSLAEHNSIIESPDRVKLISAIKISGRTKKNLGIGILNAVTDKAVAVIMDTVTGVEQLVNTESLANYNVIVLDQQFNQNSSVSFVNTSVLRSGTAFRDGVVTGLVFDIADRRNTMRASGRALMSNVSSFGELMTGMRTELDIRDIKGNFRWRVGHDLANTTFDNNDLGLARRNNYNNFNMGLSYEIFQPTPIFNSYKISFRARHQRLYDPAVRVGETYDLNTFFVMPSRLAFGLNFDYDSSYSDFFEPRAPGRFVIFEDNLGSDFFISSDFRKKFAYDLSGRYTTFFENPRRRWSLNASPRYRFSDRFFVRISSEYSRRMNNVGYVAQTEREIYLGQRDITQVESTFRASYNFDPYKAINLSFRNFWSTVNYNDNKYFNLNMDGTLNPAEYDLSQNDPNTNFNIWNLDLSFSWRFAPGSEAILLYRNQVFQQNEKSGLDYTTSLGELFAQPVQHTLSLRVVYFVDYAQLKSIFQSKG